MTRTVAIIGGGAVGCATAYELSKEPGLEVFVLEKNPRINAENQSSRNSGVIHAGIYYKKSKVPLRAKLCVKGNRLLYEFCQEHDVPYKRTGKLVVATNAIEEEYLDDVLRTATENDVPEVRKINGKEARLMEPNVRSTSAIYVPTTGIIEPTAYVKKLQWLAEKGGAYFVTGSKVVGITPDNKIGIAYELNSQLEHFEADIVINSAGLYSDEIARMINKNSPYVMEPVRGEAAKFYKTKRDELCMNGMNVYPAPYGYYNDTGKKADVTFGEFTRLLEEGKVTKSIGVHLTPTFGSLEGEYAIGNTVTIGPTSTVNIGKEDYGNNLCPEDHYLANVERFFPRLRLDDITLHQAGIRAKLKGNHDFIIEQDPKYHNFINLLGIDSPGLTSSLAIARYVKEMI